jgi:hypothetical protein
MLYGCELVGVDVEGDAGSRVAHLTGDSDDVGALTHEVRPERVPEVVERELRLTSDVEPCQCAW